MNTLLRTEKGVDLTLDDASEERVARFLHETDTEQLADWIDAHTLHPTINGDNRFRVIADRGDDLDETVVVFGEYANDAKMAVPRMGAVRAQVVREIVNPDASLLILPSSSVRERNLNFSKPERKAIRSGDLAPIMSRVAFALTSGRIDADTLVAFGPSQGALPALALPHAVSNDVAIATLEAPHTKHRSMIALASDFTRSGKSYEEIIRGNFADNDQLLKEFDTQKTDIDIALFAAGMFHPDNLALAKAMTTDGLATDIDNALSVGSSVVNGYGTEGRVSHPDVNRAIYEKIDYPWGQGRRFDSLRLDGADHSITNHYRIAGVLSKHALKLLET